MSQSFNSKTNKQLLEKLSCRKLSEQEAFEAEQDLLGAFYWLVEMDRKYSSKLTKEKNIC